MLNVQVINEIWLLNQEQERQLREEDVDPCI